MALHHVNSGSSRVPPSPTSAIAKPGLVHPLLIVVLAATGLALVPRESFAQPKVPQMEWRYGPVKVAGTSNSSATMAGHVLPSNGSGQWQLRTYDVAYDEANGLVHYVYWNRVACPDCCDTDAMSTRLAHVVARIDKSVPDERVIEDTFGEFQQFIPIPIPETNSYFVQQGKKNNYIGNVAVDDGCGASPLRHLRSAVEESETDLDCEPFPNLHTLVGQVSIDLDSSGNLGVLFAIHWNAGKTGGGEDHYVTDVRYATHALPADPSTDPWLWDVGSSGWTMSDSISLPGLTDTVSVALDGRTITNVYNALDLKFDSTNNPAFAIARGENTLIGTAEATARYVQSTSGNFCSYDVVHLNPPIASWTATPTGTLPNVNPARVRAGGIALDFEEIGGIAAAHVAMSREHIDPGAAVPKSGFVEHYKIDMLSLPSAVTGTDVHGGDISDGAGFNTMWDVDLQANNFTGRSARVHLIYRTRDLSTNTQRINYSQFLLSAPVWSTPEVVNSQLFGSAISPTFSQPDGLVLLNPAKTSDPKRDIQAMVQAEGVDALYSRKGVGVYDDEAGFASVTASSKYPRVAGLESPNGLPVVAGYYDRNFFISQALNFYIRIDEIYADCVNQQFQTDLSNLNIQIVNTTTATTWNNSDLIPATAAAFTLDPKAEFVINVPVPSETGFNTYDISWSSFADPSHPTTQCQPVIPWKSGSLTGITVPYGGNVQVQIDLERTGTRGNVVDTDQCDPTSFVFHCDTASSKGSCSAAVLSAGAAVYTTFGNALLPLIPATFALLGWYLYRRRQT